MSHFYTQAGQPCYEVENKSKPGQMRPTTLRDARKLNLVPSVTDITKMVYNPDLERWKKGQMLEFAWKVPHKGLTYEQWCGRVRDMSKTEGLLAAQTGTEIHKAIEESLKTGKCSGEYADWQRAFAGWWKVQGWWSEAEMTFNLEGYIPTIYGYGGRYDILVGYKGLILIDLKTQRGKDGKGKKKPLRFYRSWGWQLAGYGKALKADRLISVVLDSTEPSRIESFEWKDKEKLEKSFDSSLELWYDTHNLKG